MTQTTETTLSPSGSFDAAPLQRFGALAMVVTAGSLLLLLAFMPASLATAGAVRWLALGLGLLLTLTLCAFCHHLLGSNRRVALLVERRTAALEQASSALASRSAELDRARVTAESASAAKGEFLANMSHEIRTPLNSMLGMAELLLDSELAPRQQGHLKTILHSAETLLEIINDILDFSKIESGKLALEPVPFDLASAFEDIAELFGPQLRQKTGPLELVLDISTDLPSLVVGDPVRIKQVLCNLVGNAIKFTESGHVRVELRLLAPLRHDEWRIRVEVEDTGIGIPAAKQREIFEKFMQADATTTRRFGGTGLGLAISRQLVAMMGGEIGVESEPGRGSNFFFTFNVGVADDHACALPDLAIRAAADMVGPLAGLNAIIADDCGASRKMLTQLLTRHGMRCHVVSEPQRIVEKIEQGRQQGVRYDVVILDYCHEVVSAHTIERLMTRGAIVVSLLAREKEDTMQQLADMGIHAALMKPLRGSRLIGMLTELVESRRSGRQITLRHPSPALPVPLSYYVTPAEQEIDILLVEDNRVNQAFAKETLEKLGCRVVTAFNGEEAIARLRECSFDLVFMDCQMPVMDGFEAAEAIRGMIAHGIIHELPIIALTANAMKGDRERCLEAGMSDYLAKPVRKADFSRALDLWLHPENRPDMPPRHQAFLPAPAWPATATPA